MVVVLISLGVKRFVHVFFFDSGFGWCSDQGHHGLWVRLQLVDDRVPIAATATSVLTLATSGIPP